MRQQRHHVHHPSSSSSFCLASRQGRTPFLLAMVASLLLLLVAGSGLTRAQTVSDFGVVEESCVAGRSPSACSIGWEVTNNGSEPALLMCTFQFDAMVLNFNGQDPEGWNCVGALCTTTAMVEAGAAAPSFVKGLSVPSGAAEGNTSFTLACGGPVLPGDALIVRNSSLSVTSAPLSFSAGQADASAAITLENDGPSDVNNVRCSFSIQPQRAASFDDSNNENCQEVSRASAQGCSIGNIANSGSQALNLAIRVNPSQREDFTIRVDECTAASDVHIALPSSIDVSILPDLDINVTPEFVELPTELIAGQVLGFAFNLTNEGHASSLGTACSIQWAINDADEDDVRDLFSVVQISSPDDSVECSPSGNDDNFAAIECTADVVPGASALAFIELSSNPAPRFFEGDEDEEHELTFFLSCTDELDTELSPVDQSLTMELFVEGLTLSFVQVENPKDKRQGGGSGGGGSGGEVTETSTFEIRLDNDGPSIAREVVCEIQLEPASGGASTRSIAFVGNVPPSSDACSYLGRGALSCDMGDVLPKGGSGGNVDNNGGRADAVKSFQLNMPSAVRTLAVEIRCSTETPKGFEDNEQLFRANVRLGNPEPPSPDDSSSSDDSDTGSSPQDKEKSGGDTDLGPIIGGAVGGVVFLILLVAIIVAVVLLSIKLAPKYFKKKKATQKNWWDDTL